MRTPRERLGIPDDTTRAAGIPSLEPLGKSATPARLSVRVEPRYEWGSAPAGSDPYMHMLLTLAPEGPPLVKAAEGPIAHLILCLDVSASMNHADKYPVLTAAIERMLHDLHTSAGGEVLLSVILFAHGRKTIIRGLPASSLTANGLLRAIDSSPLRFGRYTDVAGALSRAGRIAYDSHKQDPALPCRIVLMTDGKPQDLAGARERMSRVAKVAVDVDALAFGSDADVRILRKLVCGLRGGTVKHVRRETLGDAYARIAEVAQRVVAKRALFRLELGRGVVGAAAYRFRPGRHSFGPDAFEQGRVFQTDLGTLESGREYSLLFKVRLPSTRASDTEVGQVSLRLPGYGGPQEFGRKLVVPRHHTVVAVASDPLVIEATQVLEALDGQDPEALLIALRTRRKMYVAERRDPYLLEVVDKAISELEAQGNLDALTSNEQAALAAHTATAGSGKPPQGRREYSFG